MPLKTTVEALVKEARARITEVDAADAVKQMDDADVLIVDVRDIRERQRDGYIPGSFHCPRGMTEFWVDPDSPYFKPEFGAHKRYLFHCAVDWRSALTVDTVTRMGFEGAGHIIGGFKAWKAAGGPVESDD